MRSRFISPMRAKYIRSHTMKVSPAMASAGRKMRVSVITYPLSSSFRGRPKAGTRNPVTFVDAKTLDSRFRGNDVGCNASDSGFRFRLPIPASEPRKPLHRPLHHQLLDLADRLRRIQTLRAGVGAVHDGMATVQPERIFQ